MNPTIITARVSDQRLRLVNVPVIASGGVDVIQIRFEFCGLWDGCGKTAVFYRDPETVYHVPIADCLVTVPWEVLVDEGYFYFGVFGEASNRRPTEVVKVEVVKGAITTATAEPGEPTPDIYEQLLAAYGIVDQALQDAKENFTDQNGGSPLRFWVGSQEQYDALPIKELNCIYIVTEEVTVETLTAAITALQERVTADEGTIAGHTETLATHTKLIAHHDDHLIAHNTDIAKHDLRIVELEEHDYIEEQDSYTVEVPILGENHEVLTKDSITWVWQKWNSGRADLYGYQVVYSAVDQPVGALYKSYEISPTYFPFTVYGATGFVDCHDCYVWCPSCIDRNIGISGEQIRYTLMSPYVGVAKPWHVCIQINGRWK